MSLLFFLRPAKSSDGGVVVPPTPTGGHWPPLTESQFKRLQRKLAKQLGYLREEVESTEPEKLDNTQDYLDEIQAQEEKLEAIKPKALKVSTELRQLIQSAFYQEYPDLITPLVKDLERLLAAIAERERRLELEEEDILTIILLLH